MTAQITTGDAGDADNSRLDELLGYVNFSSGAPTPQFQQAFNRLFARFPFDQARRELLAFCLHRLDEVEGTSSVFSDVSQARSVLPLALEECVTAYRRHHSELLAHLHDRDFDHPFLLVRMVEAVLSQGPPWDERERILSGAVEQLNDFLGYRPVAVLENGQEMQPYDREEFRPVPLFLADAGVATGPYEPLVAGALQLIATLPKSLQMDAQFDVERMDELALDMRAYDHLHPVNKRTNYIFGEWDPRVIDNSGFYRRFVLRKMILDALVRWVDEGPANERDERLFDGSAVMCGTILMASAISGCGPGAHDSTTSLATLLPGVARHRDLFYEHLFQQATGKRAKRLQAEAEKFQQPFGHVRQRLNIELSQIGAKQVHDRFLTQFFARLGYPEASRERAARIPSPAARFESEIAWRLTSAMRYVDQRDPATAAKLLEESQDLLRRGIDCGAIVDPWSILGFQGQFPLFQSREDAVPDHRVEMLLDFMAQYFEAASRAMCEAAAARDSNLARRIEMQFEQTAGWWDQFATHVVADLPEVRGGEAFESASSVAATIAAWREAGEAAGDISFWREYVDRFHSAQAYGRVVETLLKRNDDVAAGALLMQWLSQADEVGLTSGGYSFSGLLLLWVNGVKQSTAQSDNSEHLRSRFRRLFDLLEANSEDLWSVPQLTSSSPEPPGDPESFDDDTFLANSSDGWDDDDDESNLFEAAYEDVVFTDSADDGNIGDTLDGNFAPGDTEIEAINRDLEPKLEFLNALAELWQIAAEVFGEVVGRLSSDERRTVIGWLSQVRRFRRDLGRLLNEAAEFPIPEPSGDPDSNFEFDIQTQALYYLQHRLVVAATEFRSAEWALRAVLDERSFSEAKISANSRRVSSFLGHVLRGDVVRVRRELPGVTRLLSQQPLLYVSLENGGDVKKFLAARTMQSLMSLLLQRLPELGLFNETRHVLATAFRMERNSRPSGTATTEFDRLLAEALANSIRALLISYNHRPQQPTRRRPMRRGSHKRRSRKKPAQRRYQSYQPATGYRRGRTAVESYRREKDLQLLRIVNFVVEHYEHIWRKHSRSVRLSPIESLQDNRRWDQLCEFIQRYGDDLLHASMLMLSNIRAILHQGVEDFLDFLERERDPIQPIKLIEDLQEGRIDRAEACNALELIYEAVLDKLDRFVEYNTTTTQSDYGSQFFCLLDFLRVEAAYDRDAWNFRPYHTAHEVLTEVGGESLARMWEAEFERTTRSKAEKHLRKLSKLQKQYSVRLPSILDHLNQRFVKSMAVDRMRALIAPAIEESRQPVSRQQAIKKLQAEIEAYLASTAGSAIEVPDWLMRLERESQEIELQSDQAVTPRKFVDADGRYRILGPRQLFYRLSRLPEPKRRRR